LGLFINKSEMNLMEVSSKINLPQSTTYRLLVTLAGLGFIERDAEKGTYQLGVKCLALGDAYLLNNDLHQRAYKSLVYLRDQSSESVHLGFLEGAEVTYLEKLQGLHPIGLMSSRVGGHAPLYCTGLGKAMLAFLPESTARDILSKVNLIRHTDNTILDIDRLRIELTRVREVGYAIDAEENERGVGCIACPVFDGKGVVAAISISGPKDRVLNPESKEQLIRLLKRTARDVSIKMGGMNELVSEHPTNQTPEAEI
jgi:IclR family transcriptional regulator, KDG regulon repressor